MKTCHPTPQRNNRLLGAIWPQLRMPVVAYELLIRALSYNYRCVRYIRDHNHESLDPILS